MQKGTVAVYVAYAKTNQLDIKMKLAGNANMPYIQIQSETDIHQVLKLTLGFSKNRAGLALHFGSALNDAEYEK